MATTQHESIEQKLSPEDPRVARPIFTLRETRARGPLDQPPLEREHLRRRVAQLMEPDGYHPAVAPSVALSVEPRLCAWQERHHTLGAEELLGRPLKLLGVERRSGRKCPTDRQHHVTTRERRRLLSQAITNLSRAARDWATNAYSWPKRASNHRKLRLIGLVAQTS